MRNQTLHDLKNNSLNYKFLKKTELLTIPIVSSNFSSKGLLLRWVGIAFTAMLGIILMNYQSSGQENRYVFSHLNVNNDLSQNQINCVYRDTKGFVWFGTNAGLNRFDGSSFEVFNSEKSTNGLIVNNTIKAIAEDKNGNLWIGTAYGVSILNGSTYEIKNLNYTSSARNNCGDILYINSMASDKNGNIWFGTNSGCFYCDIQSNSILHILIDSTNCSSLMNGIMSIVQDNSGNMWMSSKNGFILKYNLSNNSFEKFKIPDKWNRSTNTLTRLFIDNNNDLWVGNLYGLYLFETNKREWNTRFNDTMFATDGLKRIGAISQNVDGLIWIAADGGGAFIIDKKILSITNLRHQPFDDQKLSSNGLSYVYCDQDGIVWIGTTKKGVNYYKKNIIQFRIYKNLAGDLNSLSHNDVNALVEDQKGNLWIGTDGGGLNYLCLLYTSPS